MGKVYVRYFKSRYWSKNKFSISFTHSNAFRLIMSKTKIGVIGAGWWAIEFHIPNLKKRKDVELISVCKLEEDQLKFVKNKFDIPIASSNYLEMLNMSSLDGVVVASPHFAHFANAKASLEKGCHVLVEKPMVRTLDEAKMMIDMVETSGKTLMVGQNYRRLPMAVLAKQIVEENRLGPIFYLSTEEFVNKRNQFSTDTWNVWWRVGWLCWLC